MSSIFRELHDDPRLRSNNQRVQARDWLLPILRRRFADLGAGELARRFEAVGLPYAPITRPEDLFDDPHLNATGGLAPTTVPASGSCAGRALPTQTALLPLALDGSRLPLRRDPPGLGQHSRELLRELGYDDAAVDALHAQGVVASADEAAGA